MKHRVLIVSPHFPPINAADHQRIRMSLPYFAEFEWDVTVLCVDANFIEGKYDPNLNVTVPENIEIIRSLAISPKLSRKLKIGNLAFRSIPFLINAVAKQFEQNYFDLVYFSNTVFLTMPLGRYWLERYKVPYVLDFQDPWLNDYYDRTNNLPPGGKLKYATVQSFAKILEPFTMKKASHITSVSPEYPKVLMQRYSWLKAEQFTVLPFGAPKQDFQILASLKIKQQIFEPNDGYQHWVYVGRGGEDMSFSLKLLFSAIATHRQQHPEAWQKIKLHFVGTKYSVFDNNKEIEAIAKSHNIYDIVTEHPQRIPYFEALQVLVDSHAILIIGSDDASYSASKVYPCILACKPILAILHQQSLVVDVIRACRAGYVITFTNDSIKIDILDRLTQGIQWLLKSCTRDFIVTTDWQAFEPYTAKRMTQVLCNIFDKVAK